MATGNDETTTIPAKTKEEIDKIKTKNDAIQYAHDITQKYNALFDEQNITLKRYDEINNRLGKLEQLIKADQDENKMLCREVSRLNNRVVSLEREVLNRDQYARRRQLELWNLPETITNEKNNEQLKTKVATILSITGTEVKADDIDVVHPIKKEG